MRIDFACPSGRRRFSAPFMKIGPSRALRSFGAGVDVRIRFGRSSGFRTAAFLIVGMLAIFPSMCRAQAAPSPLVAEPAIFEFGKKFQNEEFQGAFVLKNPTDQAVTIRSVTFHCSCASGKTNDLTIPAKGETTLDFTFHTRNFEGDVVKNCDVAVVGSTSILQLTMRGTVMAGWTIDTEAIELGAVKPGQRVEREFVIDCREGADPGLEFRAPNNDVKIEVKREREAPLKIRVKVSIEVGAAERIGAYIRSVVCRAVKDEAKPVRIVTLTGRIEGDLEVTPRSLSFGKTKNDKEERRTIVIESKSKTPFKILNIRTDQTVLVEGEKNVAKARHELTIVLQKGLPARVYRSMLAFQTDHPDEPNFTITTMGQIESAEKAVK